VVVSKIIGREEELAFLEERLDAVSKGETAAVVLEGDAGIGKTTLFQAGLRAALAREYRVLSSRPATSEVQLSYAALGDLLEGVLPETAVALPVPQLRALENALRLREEDTAASDRRTIALAFLNVVRELARSKPLVVAVDDVQWIATPTAAVLEFAARRLDHEPVGCTNAITPQIGDFAPAGRVSAPHRRQHSVPPANRDDPAV